MLEQCVESQQESQKSTIQTIKFIKDAKYISKHTNSSMFTSDDRRCVSSFEELAVIDEENWEFEPITVAEIGSNHNFSLMGEEAKVE